MIKLILGFVLALSVAQSALANGPFEVKQVDGINLVLVPLVNARQIKAINDSPKFNDQQKMIKIKPIMKSMISESYCKQAASVYASKQASAASLNRECLQIRANIEANKDFSQGTGIEVGTTAEDIRFIYSLVLRTFIRAD
jgi:hypothetical protein